MYEYDEECLKVFLKKQLQLFDEPVADNVDEAEAAGAFERHPGCGCVITYDVGKTRTWSNAACPPQSTPLSWHSASMRRASA